MKRRRAEMYAAHLQQCLRQLERRNFAKSALTCSENELHIAVTVLFSFIFSFTLVGQKRSQRYPHHVVGIDNFPTILCLTFMFLSFFSWGFSSIKLVGHINRWKTPLQLVNWFLSLSTLVYLSYSSSSSEGSDNSPEHNSWKHRWLHFRATQVFTWSSLWVYGNLDDFKHNCFTWSKAKTEEGIRFTL